MTLGKVKHFLHGWVVGFVVSLAMGVVGYILSVLATSFLLWAPVTVVGAIPWLAIRMILAFCVFGATWFASSKEWRSKYQGNTQEEN